MQYKQDKIAMSIQKYVSDIIQFKLKKNDLGIITVTHCEVTSDYSFAKLYVTFLGRANKEEALEELKNTKGFIRGELAKKLTLYKTPDLIFVLDESYDHGQRIEQVIKEIHEKEKKDK